jgi:hypothetical protein
VRLCFVPVMLLCAQMVLAGDAAPKVRAKRPRIFVRAENWAGPSIPKIREWLKQPDYRKRMEKLGRTPLGKATLALITGDKKRLAKAVEIAKKFRIAGTTPARWSDDMVHAAMLYDWFHDRLDAASRKTLVADMETWGDKAMAYLKGGGATPFYDRTSGVMAGLTVVGLALHGDSAKADEYVKYAHTFFKDRFSTCREAEEGAAGGGGYSYYWLYRQMGHTVAAWRSATDWDAADWIAKNQGDWLRKQITFQIWMTYPNGWFVKEGDLWLGSHNDHSQYRQALDMVTGMYRDGVGRTFAGLMHKRHGIHDYNSAYVWQFLLFNDPTIKPKPLSTLGKTAVFSPKLHGYVSWRSSWKDDATIVHFRCGETIYHHATWDQGKFILFRKKPLAIKNGAYVGYMSGHHVYYKSPWSANCVVFTSDKLDGNQPRIDFDGTPSWKEWKAKRDKRVKRPPTGVLLKHEANEKYAYAKGDLSAATRGSKWTRELVFLGYKYLVVLDRVKAAEGVTHRWLLQLINEPKWRLSPNLIMADVGDERLFCQTLLPEKPKFTTVGGPWNEFNFNGKNKSPKYWHRIRERHKRFPEQMQLGSWRVEVTPAVPAVECTYLHVLVPTDTKTFDMPKCSVERKDGKLIVKVGDLSHTFNGE